MGGNVLYRDVARGTAVALVLSALFAYDGAAPWAVSLTVLLLAGPGTELLLTRIGSAHPVEESPFRPPRWFRSALIGWVAVAAALALAASKWLHVGYWRAFARTWLILTAAGAVNAIVAEWEDRRPGGFLNP